MYEKIKKANNMMRLIRRSLIQLDEEMFLKLFEALVRSHWQHANVLWHPTKIKDTVVKMSRDELLNIHQHSRTCL